MYSGYDDAHGSSTDTRGMIKYGFKVRTRSGMVVDNLTFAARDRSEAERKVTQIYQHCEILDCRELQQMVKEEGFDLESAINLINKQSVPGAPAKD
jgi:hypothetical protein